MTFRFNTCNEDSRRVRAKPRVKRGLQCEEKAQQRVCQGYVESKEHARSVGRSERG